MWLFGFKYRALKGVKRVSPNVLNSYYIHYSSRSPLNRQRERNSLKCTDRKLLGWRASRTANVSWSARRVIAQQTNSMWSCGVRTGMLTVASLIVLRAFLRTGRFLPEIFGTGLQITPDPAPAMTPERFPGVDTPVGQSHQSQVPFQVGRGQAQIWLSLKRCKGAYLMPSRPASWYHFDHWDTAAFRIHPGIEQPQPNPLPLWTPPLMPDACCWQLLNRCMGKAWHKGVPGQVTWTSGSATHQDILLGHCWKPEGKVNRKATTWFSLQSFHKNFASFSSWSAAKQGVPQK